MTDYCVSSPFATACVTVDVMGIIVDAAPIFHTFEGQSLDSLVKWLESKHPGQTIVSKLGT